LKEIALPVQGDQLYADRYKIVAPIYEDFMGRVFVAEDTLLDNFVVDLKIFDPHLYTSSIDHDKLYQELQFTKEINHPNIIRTFEVGKFQGDIYLTREHVNGISLESAILQGKPLLDKTVRLLRDVCAGLAAIHDKGVVHGNLYPSSIFTDANGFTKVADFGISLSPYSDAIEDQELLTILKFKAPEIANGRQETKLSDLYSLGVIIYKLLTDKYPFEGESIEQTNEMHRNMEAPEILDASIPPNFKRTCLKLLHKEAPRRAQSVVDVLKFFAGSMAPLPRSTEFAQPTVITGIPEKEESSNPGFQSYATMIAPEISDADSLRKGILSKEAETRMLQALQLRNKVTGEAKTHNSKQNEPILGLALFGSSIIIVPILSLTFLIPWNTLQNTSAIGSTNPLFVMAFILSMLGISIFVATPAVFASLVYSTLTMSKISFGVWRNCAALCLGIFMCLVSWEVLQSPGSTLNLLFLNPPQLYLCLKKSIQMMLHLAFLIPRLSLEDTNLIYYNSLAIYALGMFGILQVNGTKRELGSIFCCTFLAVLVFLEYYVPGVFAIELYSLTTAVINIPLGDYKFALSKYDLICGMINWSVVIVFLVLFGIGQEEKRLKGSA
jgi:serine/threonine protein kinase